MRDRNAVIQIDGDKARRQRFSRRVFVRGKDYCSRVVSALGVLHVA